MERLKAKAEAKRRTKLKHAEAMAAYRREHMDSGPLLLGELRELVLQKATDLSAVSIRSMARFDGLRRLRVLELEGAVALMGPLMTSETALKAMELTPGGATAMAALEAKARKANGTNGDEYDGGEHEVTGPTAAGEIPSLADCSNIKH